MQKKYIVIIDKDLEEIIPSFLNNRKKELEIMPSLIQEKNFPELQSIGHKLSGNAPSYGFDKLGDIGLIIEQSAKENNMEIIQQQFDLYKILINTIEIKYE